MKNIIDIYKENIIKESDMILLLSFILVITLLIIYFYNKGKKVK